MILDQNKSIRLLLSSLLVTTIIFITCSSAAAAAASSSFHSRKSRHHSLHLQHFGTQQQRQSPRPTILYPTVFQPLQKEDDEAIISHNLNSSFELTTQLSSARALALSEMSGEHPSNDIIDPNFDFLPWFSKPIANVTVVIGRDAILKCAVENLGKYKVAWIFVSTHSILTIHNKIITRNYRITLDFQQTDDRVWVLKISNVVEADRGFYMCQVNTDPMRSEAAYLEVLVPPDILDNGTSTDTVAREGFNVSLSCHASGHPRPKITWRREDGSPIAQGRYVGAWDGSELYLPMVSRLQMGAYLCIASNSVPPTVSKRTVLNVHFAPELWLPNQLEGSSVGREIKLLCKIEGYPIPVVYWKNAKGDMLVNNWQFDVKTLMTNEYKMTMILLIRNLTLKDFGSYRCVAQNSLGKTDGLIRLYEVPATPHSEDDYNSLNQILESNQMTEKSYDEEIMLGNEQHRKSIAANKAGGGVTGQHITATWPATSSTSHSPNNAPSITPTPSWRSALCLLFTRFLCYALLCSLF